MYQVFAPYMELVGRPFPASLEQIKDAGFDGVECHLVGGLRKPKRCAEIFRATEALGLRTMFHQGWSWDTGQRNMFNRILRCVGALVPTGTSFETQVSECRKLCPVVVYGNHCLEQRHDRLRFQTASLHRNGRDYLMDFEQFVQVACDRCLPVVFDTQHVLEWSLNVHGVDKITLKPAEIHSVMSSLWSRLRNNVVEIHLCDFDPARGRSRGRNVNLGQGIFPFDEFCALVRSSGWNGVVVPEVSPNHLKEKGKLQELYRTVRRLMG